MANSVVSVTALLSKFEMTWQVFPVVSNFSLRRCSWLQLMGYLGVVENTGFIEGDVCLWYQAKNRFGCELEP